MAAMVKRSLGGSWFRRERLQFNLGTEPVGKRLFLEAVTVFGTDELLWQLQAKPGRACGVRKHASLEPVEPQFRHRLIAKFIKFCRKAPVSVEVSAKTKRQACED